MRRISKMFRRKKKKPSGKNESLSRNAWNRFKRDRLAMFGVFILFFACMVAILGSLIRPDQTKDVAQKIITIDRQPPGFKTMVLRRMLDQKIEHKSIFDRMFFGGKEPEYAYYAIDDYNIDGQYLSVRIKDPHGRREDTEVFHLASILYPLNYDNQYLTSDNGDSVTFMVIDQGKVTRSIDDLAKEVKAEHIFERTYWLGTDRAGKDLLSLIMASIIVSLAVGLLAVLISLTVGITLGAIAGYFRGWVDDLVMYIINVIWSIPALLIVISIAVAMGHGFETVFIAVGFILWVEVARLVRGQVMSVREKEFIEASRALGYGPLRIIALHILPNIMGPIIVIAAANFAYAILIESGLSFLGIGTQAPQPSLGMLVGENRVYIDHEGEAYLAILPGVAIVILVLAFMLIGNGVRDALDSKSTEEVPADDATTDTGHKVDTVEPSPAMDAPGDSP